MITRIKKFDKYSVLWLFALLMMILIVLVPLYFMLKYSVSDRSSLVTGGETLPLWPYSPTLDTYKYILSYPDFYRAAAVSLKLAFMTITISMLLGVPGAYVLSRHNIPGKAILLVGLISVRLFPDIVSIIPVAVAFARMHLHDTYLGAALAHSLLSLPYVLYICMGVFDSIPKDLERQAEILGAGKITILFKIIGPISLTGLSAAAIYTFLLSWDEFIFSYFLLGFGELQTLPLYLKQKMAFAPPQDLLMAISVLLSLPVILFTMVLQRYMRAGFTAGAVK
ncbi:MAG: carbohydrate ABC transporter permease [Fibrobacteres bacterium]|nr:carbohydrate ABC transporter permease [Fibrobacterota bacterium]